MTQRETDSYESFRKYYSSDLFFRYLFLPEKSSMHHFRLRLFSNNRFYRVEQTIKYKRELQDLIFREQPRDIYFTPVKWLDPLNIRRKPTDYMLSSPLYFDIDSEKFSTISFSRTKKMTHMLIDYIKGEFGRKPSWVVFSGKRGFHVYYWDWDSIPREYPRPEQRIRAFKEERRKILDELSKKGIIVDESVTIDPWRILRVPGTLHGETLQIALKMDDLESFSQEQSRIKNVYRSPNKWDSEQRSEALKGMTWERGSRKTEY